MFSTVYVLSLRGKRIGRFCSNATRVDVAAGKVYFLKNGLASGNIVFNLL